MQKLLASCLCITSLLLGGCNTLEELGNAMPDALGNTPLMYKPTVQQGNVVTQEMVDKLQPGMNRRQVTYILGTPLLVDAFHQDRWDYVYTKEVGGGAGNKTHISLLFEDDILVRIEGDFRPEPKDDPLADAEETVFTVPDYKGEDKGFFSSALESVGINTGEDENIPSADATEDGGDLPDMNKENSGELPQTAEEAQAQVEAAQATEENKAEQAEEETTSEEEDTGFFDRALEVIGLD